MSDQKHVNHPKLNKPFCSLKEIKEHLIQKNFEEITIDLDAFKEINYTELVSPYKIFFINSTNGNFKNYSKNLDFTTIMNWAKLDQTISALLHIYIGFFERKLRSYTIDSLCALMKQNNDSNCVDYSFFDKYLDPSASFIAPCGLLSRDEIQNYQGNDYCSLFINDQLTSLINAIKDCFDVNNQRGSMIRSHYIKKYNQIPAYIALTELSLGETITLFSILPMEKQAAFWVAEKGKKSSEANNREYLLSQYRALKEILKIRNTVNHFKSIISLLKNYIDSNKDKKISDIFKYLKTTYKNAKINIDSNITITKPTLPLIYNPALSSTKNKLKTLIDSLY